MGGLVGAARALAGLALVKVGSLALRAGARLAGAPPGDAAGVSLGGDDEGPAPFPVRVTPEADGMRYYPPARPAWGPAAPEVLVGSLADQLRRR